MKSAAGGLCTVPVSGMRLFSGGLQKSKPWELERKTEEWRVKGDTALQVRAAGSCCQSSPAAQHSL